MSAEEKVSDAPVELAPGGIKIRVRWKVIAGIFGFLFAGGSLAGVGAMFNVGTSVAGDFDAFKVEQGSAHRHIDSALELQDKHAKEQDGKVEGISKAISLVQITQQRDVARTEARRLTEKITNRQEREEAYDRLYELNLRRLQRGVDPCGTISCP
jgi:hypothetical protein